MDLQEVGCGWVGMDWIDLVHDRAGKSGNEPSGSIKCRLFLD